MKLVIENVGAFTDEQWEAMQRDASAKAAIALTNSIAVNHTIYDKENIRINYDIPGPQRFFEPRFFVSKSGDFLRAPHAALLWFGCLGGVGVVIIFLLLVSTSGSSADPYAFLLLLMAPALALWKFFEKPAHTPEILAYVKRYKNTR